jgi:hypothetical protein
MMLVLIFLVVLLTLLGVVFRRMAGLLRTETVHCVQIQRDEGSIHALGRALSLLETGLPPTSPYVCGVTLPTSSGPRAITVKFTQTGTATWTVHAAPTAPGQYPEPMPDTF